LGPQLLVLVTLVVTLACSDKTPGGIPETVSAGGGVNGRRQTLLRNLDTPWSIAFLPDGRMLFTERGGRVSIVENGSRWTIGTVDVVQQGEAGLLGIAVDPDFDKNRYIYLYYTHPIGNRVARFVMTEQDALTNETVLIDQIPQAIFHNGGRIRFGPDGKLYITTGDAQKPELAQDIRSLAGKILRIEKDGLIPRDNPFRNPVWAYGLRNPQGIDWHPVTGSMYASDHGPNRMDEVVVIERGGNYGWPKTCDQTGDWIPAVRCYEEFTLAPCGIAFHGDQLFVAALRGAQVRQLSLPGDKLTQESAFLTDLGRIRDVVAHDGWLYVATSNLDGRGRVASGDDQIVRIRLD